MNTKLQSFTRCFGRVGLCIGLKIQGTRFDSLRHHKKNWFVAQLEESPAFNRKVMSSNLIGPTWKHSSKEERSAVNGRMNVRFILFPQLKSKLIFYMKNVINILQQIEKEYQVKILFACETGRELGDFHRRIAIMIYAYIYMHERDWYLSLNEKKIQLSL